MERYGGEFHRKVKFGVVGNVLKPIHLAQTNTDYDTGETMDYDSTMESGYIEKLLKKYSKWFKNIFMATRSRYLDMVEKEKAPQEMGDENG